MVPPKPGLASQTFGLTSFSKRIIFLLSSVIEEKKGYREFYLEEYSLKISFSKKKSVASTPGIGLNDRRSRIISSSSRISVLDCLSLSYAHG